MIINSANAKRLGIYFFYDKNGIVDRYIPYFLEDFKKNLTDLLIVSNGEPTEQGAEILQNYGELFARENKGFDVWAYKEALEHVGWEKLEEYDEVIINMYASLLKHMKDTSDLITLPELDLVSFRNAYSDIPVRQ